MAGGKKMDRRGSGPWFFIAIAFLVFCIYSLAVAASTADDCGSGSKSWELIPPGWECNSVRSFG